MFQSTPPAPVGRPQFCLPAKPEPMNLPANDAMIARPRRPIARHRAIGQSELPVDLRIQALANARRAQIRNSVLAPSDRQSIVRAEIGLKEIAHRARRQRAESPFATQLLRHAQRADVTEPALAVLGHPAWHLMRRRPHPRSSAPRAKRRDRALSIWIVVLMTMMIPAAKLPMRQRTRRSAG